MTKQEENLARERKEIAARVASFKATQEKFRREREQYFATTLENARNEPRANPADSGSSGCTGKQARARKSPEPRAPGFLNDQRCQ